MAEITYFMVVPFDYVDNGIVAGAPIGCRVRSPLYKLRWGNGNSLATRVSSMLWRPQSCMYRLPRAPGGPVKPAHAPDAPPLAQSRPANICSMLGGSRSV
jgi:hypothetical protein